MELWVPVAPFNSQKWNYEWQWLTFSGTINSEQLNYEWKRLFVGTVPAIFYHWSWNYDWTRLFFGTVPVFFIDHGTMTGRGYLWVLSLQFFVIALGTMTMTGSSYFWALSLKILVLTIKLWLEQVICGYFPCKSKIKNAWTKKWFP